MLRILFNVFILIGSVNAFSIGPHRTTTTLKKNSALYASSDGDAPQQQPVVPVGSFVEFEEKGRNHVGKVVHIEHKSNGGARYDVVDHEGKKYGIPDKAVLYAMHAPNSPGAAQKLFDDFCKIHDADEQAIQSKLDISTDLLEMAWEESSEESEDHLLTAAGLVELVQGHAASAIEKYMAWRLLKSEKAHIFFKEIKDHGRVVAFKAKARKAVEAAKHVFCMNNLDSDLCFV